MSDTPEAPLGVQLGLGPGWQPSGGIINFIKLDSDQGPIHVMRVATITGTFGVVFNNQLLNDFAHQVNEVASGLVLPPPPTLIVPGG